MATRIQWRRGTAAAWTTADTILAEGEAGMETDTGKFKLGDGTTAWTDLEYAAATPAELDALEASVSASYVTQEDLAAAEFGAAGFVVAPAPTGTNDSAALIAVADALPGGVGVIRLRPTVGGSPYKAQGLPIRTGLYWQGAGQGATVIELPATPSDHMFKTTGTTAVTSGGVRGCELDGNGTATYDCFNFTSLSQLDAYEVVENYIHHFRTGWIGSTSNDRWPLIAHNRIWNCSVGISGEEHPIVHHNDVRDCPVGMEGRFNDFYSVGNKFNYCPIGVRPKSGQGISNSHFVQNQFYANLTMALEVTGSSRVIGCQFYPASGSLLGVLLNGSLNSVQDCHFGQSGGFTYVESLRFGSTVARCKVRGNTFVSTAGTSITDTGTGTCNDIDITGNTFFLSNQSAVIFDTAKLHSSVISGNVIRYTGTTWTTSPFVVEDTLGLGNVWMGNTFAVEGGSTMAYAIRADVRFSVVVGNRLRNFTQANALQRVNTDANTQVSSNIGMA